MPGPPQAELQPSDSGHDVRGVEVDSQDPEGVVEDDVIDGMDDGRGDVDDERGGVTHRRHQVSSVLDVAHRLVVEVVVKV